MTEQQTSLSQHLINSNSALNKKVDKLAEALENLTIGDDLKDYISHQLAGIKQEGNKQDYKVKDLDVFDGKKQKLRSWLTAANLQLPSQQRCGRRRTESAVHRWIFARPSVDMVRANPQGE
jgi:hypothetical protein